MMCAGLHLQQLRICMSLPAGGAGRGAGWGLGRASASSWRSRSVVAVAASLHRATSASSSCTCHGVDGNSGRNCACHGMQLEMAPQGSPAMLPGKPRALGSVRQPWR